MGGRKKCCHLLRVINYSCKKFNCTSPWMHWWSGYSQDNLQQGYVNSFGMGPNQESNQNILSKLSILDSILAIIGLSVLALGCTEGLCFPKTTYNLVTFIILVWAPYQESKLWILY